MLKNKMADIPPNIFYRAFSDIARYYDRLRPDGTFAGWANLAEDAKDLFLNQIHNRALQLQQGVVAPFVPAAAQPIGQAAVAGVVARHPWLKPLLLVGGTVGAAALGVVYQIYKNPNWLTKIEKDVIKPAKKYVEENKPDALSYIKDQVAKSIYGQQMAYPIELQKLILPDKPFMIPEPENPGSERLLRLNKYIQMKKLGPNSPEQLEIEQAEKAYNEWKQLKEQYTQGVVEKMYAQGPATEAAVKAEESGILPPHTSESAAKLAEFEQPKIAAAGAKPLTEWQKFVKKYAEEHKLTYFDALKKASEPYKKLKKSKKVSK